MVSARSTLDGGGRTAGMVASTVGGGLKLLGEPLELLLLLHQHYLHLAGFIVVGGPPGLDERQPGFAAVDQALAG